MRLSKKAAMCVIFLIVLMVCTFSVKAVGPDSIKEAETAKGRADYNLANNCQDGAILHAWNWYFRDVTENIEEIAKAGYTSVQVSPIQKEKIVPEGLPRIDKWWALYQPVNFRIGNILGSREEFIQMCNRAHEYGVKIIVDVVTNHLANAADDKMFEVSDQVDGFIRDNPKFWHSVLRTADDESRFNMTQMSIGMPDLNTGNKELQMIILEFLNDCQECGADGFRFDAAKHIELPVDKEEFRSDYWPTIIEGVRSKNQDAYIYGELLNPNQSLLQAYSCYMNVTVDAYADHVRNAVRDKNAGWAWSYAVDGVEPKKLVTWVESHDDYAGNNGCGKSTSLTDKQIKLGWSLIAGRAESAPMFFVRPKDGLVGSIGFTDNNIWKDPMVVAANKFHNDMIGKSEYIRLPAYSVFMVERGDKDVILTNVGDCNEFILTKTGLVDGYYLDDKESNAFSVNGGVLMGNIAPEESIILKKVDIE